MTTAKLLLLSSSFSPAHLFRSGEYGAWLDPSELTSMKQEAAGITAAASGSVVGFMQDRRNGLAIGSDVVTNGGFDSDTSWTKGASWSISGGTANAGGTGSNLSQARTLRQNTLHRVTYTIVSMSSGNVKFQFQGGSAVAGAIRSGTTGTFTEYLNSGDNNAIAFVSGGVTPDVKIDNVVVQPLPGSVATQTTDANRPLLSGTKLDYDGVNDSLVITFQTSLGSACTVARSVPHGEATILTGQTIGATYTDSTDHCGLVIINRALTATETNQLRRWLNRRAG